MDFGKALTALKQGKPVYRGGWNGKGIYLFLQRPDERSKMTLPYIYIETSDLQTFNPDAPKGRDPFGEETKCAVFGEIPKEYLLMSDACDKMDIAEDKAFMNVGDRPLTMLERMARDR